MHTQGNPAPHWLFWLLNAVFTLFVITSSLWLCLAIWVQQPLGMIGSSVLIGLWIILACAVLGIYFSRHLISRGVDTLLYILAFLFSLFWYFSLDARQDREWNPEVARFSVMNNKAIKSPYIMCVILSGCQMGNILSAGKVAASI